MEAVDNKLTRIGVFYDGGYFHAVSNYYNFVHDRRSRISIEGLHRFAEQQVAKCEETNARWCKVVDAHYFRGRYSIDLAIERNKLESERRFNDVLIRAGVVTHFLPRSYKDEEKGIDVWFALEAFELAVYKRFNVLVLVACDADYVPLVRKLNTLGTRVMLFGWDFKYTDQTGSERETRTAQALINEVSYYIPMHEVIDRRDQKAGDVDLLFHKITEQSESERVKLQATPSSKRRKGKINRLKDGYGFVTDSKDKKSRFFFFGDVADDRFNELNVGDLVEFTPEEDDKNGKAHDIRVIEKA